MDVKKDQCVPESDWNKVDSLKSKPERRRTRYNMNSKWKIFVEMESEFSFLPAEETKRECTKNDANEQAEATLPSRSCDEAVVPQNMWEEEE